MAQPYLAGHLAPILGDIGQLSGAIHANATSRLTTGDPDHILVCQIRTIMTCIIWVFALAGSVLRLRRRYPDTSYVLLAIVPFPIVLVQSYGGEMLMRIYLFTLPMMAFFAAALFYTPLTKANIAIPPKLGLPAMEHASTRRPGLVTTLFIGMVSVALLAGFLFTRYGNERVDYVTNAELTGVRHLYSIAPKGSLFLAGWNETSWQFQDIERYSYYVLSDDDGLAHALTTHNIDPVVQLIDSSKVPAAYVILSRSQEALVERDGLPPDTLNQFEHALLTSRQFVLVYHNRDAQIYQFIGKK
jgi:hypothetical protein